MSLGSSTWWRSIGEEKEFCYDVVSIQQGVSGAPQTEGETEAAIGEAGEVEGGGSLQRVWGKQLHKLSS